MIKFLKANGFKEVRQNGSHKFLINEETKRSTTIPDHNGDLNPNTERAILKQAGLSKYPCKE